ncbi:hypothetical protein PCC7424_5655 (plasmid) [Gloeothece citriformis PCC 7424]|uniref:TIR domain-containing protein n=1 Tax=Gloeothece citriformis (strain PCC 7424) TaxID=65393 RepID=B7KLQ5_GLOC7|nr:toll/interleukin-1 receptor domain-containing protein [Gloeothece citriformis]ACK73727.1 hypothetical protein PCC7424_5655 [Gloeothece citriformis PCC 7424]
MKIFISWSKQPSQDIAVYLRDWLQDLFENINPFVSSEDIDKGKRWNERLSEELKDTNFGLICVTKDNQTSPWLNFEAGALSKLPASNVCTLLFGLSANELTGPLEQFQSTKYDQKDYKRLILTINKIYPNPLPEDRLTRKFEIFWPQLTEKLDPLLQTLNKTVFWIHEQAELNTDTENAALKTEISNLTAKTYNIDQLPNATEPCNLIIYVYSQSNQSTEKLKQVITFVKSLPQPTPLVIYTPLNRRLNDEEFQLSSPYKLANKTDTLIQRCKESLN